MLPLERKEGRTSTRGEGRGGKSEVGVGGWARDIVDWRVACLWYKCRREGRWRSRAWAQRLHACRRATKNRQRDAGRARSHGWTTDPGARALSCAPLQATGLRALPATGRGTTGVSPSSAGWAGQSGSRLTEGALDPGGGMWHPCPSLSYTPPLHVHHLVFTFVHLHSTLAGWGGLRGRNRVQ